MADRELRKNLSTYPESACQRTQPALIWCHTGCNVIWLVSHNLSAKLCYVEMLHYIIGNITPVLPKTQVLLMYLFSC